MNQVFNDEEWKHAHEGAAVKPGHPRGRMTRAEAQRRLDDLYALGKINLETWRVRTSIMGEPTFRSYDALV